MSDPKTGAKLTPSGWVVDCDEVRKNFSVKKWLATSFSTHLPFDEAGQDQDPRPVDCKRCGLLLPVHRTKEPGKFPVEVEPSCDCTDRILGA